MSTCVCMCMYVCARERERGSMVGVCQLRTHTFMNDIPFEVRGKIYSGAFLLLFHFPFISPSPF